MFRKLPGGVVLVPGKPQPEAAETEKVTGARTA